MSSLPYNTTTKSVSVTATAGGASSNVLYTCPTNFDGVVTFLHVSNGAASTDNVSIQWYHAEENTYFTILNNKAIAGNDVYNMITSDRLYLHAGDKITCFNGGGDIGVTIAVQEHYNPNR